MKMSEIIAQANRESRNPLEPEAYQILNSYGIPVPDYGIATAVKEALECSNSMGYPVALKVISPEISHKSDMDAVILDLKSDRDVEDGFLRLKNVMNSIESDVDMRGVLVAKMMPKGREIIIGMVKDPQFGPAILFGLGGVFVDILKDVSYRVAPLTKNDAEQMIQEIKGYAILKGARNTESSDIEALIDIILKVSKLAVDLPEIEELDLNPVLVYGKSACVVDARIILNSSGEVS